MPRKKLKDQRKNQSVSRLDILEERIQDLSDPEDIMLEITDVFKNEVLLPEVGNYYTFIYNPKTPDITYDQHPLIAVIGVEKWGIRAINYHWNDTRNYSWAEIAGKFHVVEDDEIMSMRNINYAKFKRS